MPQEMDWKPYYKYPADEIQDILITHTDFFLCVHLVKFALWVGISHLSWC